MACVYTFIAGLIIGTAIGMLVMALAAITKYEPRKEDSTDESEDS